MRLNLITEPSESTQLPSSAQCAPTYCILEPGSNRVAVGLRNILVKSITIPSGAAVGQLQQAKMVPNDQASKKQDKLGPNRGKEGTWVLDQLNVEGLNSWTSEQQQSAKNLLVESADVCSQNELDLGKCNILKHDIKLLTPSLSRKGIEGYHLTCMRK